MFIRSGHCKKWQKVTSSLDSLDTVGWLAIQEAASWNWSDKSIYSRSALSLRDEVLTCPRLPVEINTFSGVWHGGRRECKVSLWNIVLRCKCGDTLETASLGQRTSALIVWTIYEYGSPLNPCPSLASFRQARLFPFHHPWISCQQAICFREQSEFPFSTEYMCL